MYSAISLRPPVPVFSAWTRTPASPSALVNRNSAKTAGSGTKYARNSPSLSAGMSPFSVTVWEPSGWRSSSAKVRGRAAASEAATVWTLLMMRT